MKRFKLMKIRKSTIFLILIASPALFVFIDDWLINVYPVKKVEFLSAPQKYTESFRIYSTKTRYEVHVSLKTPHLKSFLVKKIFGWNDHTFHIFLCKNFNFQWVLLENNAVIAKGDSGMMESIMVKSVWNEEKDSVDYIFHNAFTAKPWKKYDLEFNLLSVPDDVGVKSGLSVELDRDETRALLFSLSFLWMLILSPFIIFKSYKFIRASLKRGV